MMTMIMNDGLELDLGLELDCCFKQLDLARWLGVGVNAELWWTALAAAWSLLDVAPFVPLVGRTTLMMIVVVGVR